MSNPWLNYPINEELGTRARCYVLTCGYLHVSSGSYVCMLKITHLSGPILGFMLVRRLIFNCLFPSAAHFHQQIHSTRPVTLNELKPKGCDKTPITTSTIIASLLETHFSFLFTHRGRARPVAMSGNGVVPSVDVCVKANDRGACVCTCMHKSFLQPVTSGRLMVRNVQQGGNTSTDF